jgi:methylthioxylose transferase
MRRHYDPAGTRSITNRETSPAHGSERVRPAVASRGVQVVLDHRGRRAPVILDAFAWPVAGALTAWALLVVAGHLLGAALYDRQPLVHIGAAPLVGSFDVRWSARALPALALAAAALAWAPGLAARMRWRALLAASWAAAGGWAVALASSDGWDALAAPLASRYEQLTAVPLVGSPGSFLETFSDALPGYATHVQGHPPGGVLVLWAMDRVGLGGAAAAAALAIACGAIAAPAALLAVRALASEAHARAAAPFLAFSPAAVWVATSLDALSAGVGAAGIALFALACTAPPGRRQALLASCAGVALGAALMLSYGMATLGALVVAIALGRRPAALAWTAAGVAFVLAAFLVCGFNWLEGLQATREQYLAGISRRRPFAEFLLISPAAFALATGPAAAAACARLRERGVWLLTGGALVALAAADLSGMSKGETERIWLHLVPWLLVATAALQRRRGWLAAQLALALALQLGVRSPW